MFKYLFGSVLVFVIAFYVVNYGLKSSTMTERIDEAMDVPYGEYDSLRITKADEKEDGWVLSLGNLRMYASRTGKGTMCSSDVKIYFPTEKNAKLVMKLRYNLGPFLAKPLRDMSPQTALKPDSQYAMMQSLKDGYANQYGIKTMTRIEFSGFSCKQMQ